ncbi:MAG: shikimate dehydrogenase [Rhodospirillales bacterium]|nr:shikimate dehydrogenase [Rhodospirillales bacterium]
MISGRTRFIAHLGYPTGTFKAPMIYNPYFESIGLDAVVLPMGVDGETYPSLLRPLFRATNIIGALITMPLKVASIGLVDEVSPTARIAGAANAVRRLEDGRLVADMFDGEGFVGGALRHGRAIAGAAALVVGAGGVGSAIAASLAKAGAGRLALYDVSAVAAEALARRLVAQYPRLALQTGSNDPAGFDIVVNATPLGMHDDDELPFDPARLDAGAFVGEVVMKAEHTKLLRAALARGCRVQVGTDMLFEQIPAYLDFFGLPVTTPQRLRALARITY